MDGQSDQTTCAKDTIPISLPFTQKIYLLLNRTLIHMSHFPSLLKIARYFVHSRPARTRLM